MRVETALVATVSSLSLIAPTTALASGGVQALIQPEDDVEVIEDDGPSEQERLDQAKALYAEAEGLAAKGDWKQAEAKYEEAYHLVPSKHGFAFKVGMAANNADDCPKAVEYLVHFIHYTDHEKHADKVLQSREVLGALLESGCTTEQEIHYYHLDDEARSEIARDLYTQAETAAAEGRWKEAEGLYEEAYYLVPHKVGFAHKVGMAAREAEDCDKAHEYLVHFVEIAHDEKYADKVEESKALIAELEATCVSKEEVELHHLGENHENPFENEGADEELPGDGGRKKKKKRTKGEGGNGLLIGGAVLVALGVGGVGVGGAGLGLAASSSNTLDDLASTNTASGYPDADYSCRGVSGEQCVPTVEQQLRNRRVMGIVGMAAGGALLVTGVALLAVHFSKQGKQESASARLRPRLDAVSPVLMPAGAGAAARVRF